MFEEEVESMQYQQTKIAMEVMQEIYARLPYGQEFTLSNGSKCKLKKFVPPKISHRDCEHQYEGRPECAFDVIIEGGKLDHLEFYIFQTGGGGFCINPPKAGDA